MSQRVAVRGNADREVAFEISKEDKTTTRGLIVVLQASVQLQESSLSTTTTLSTEPTMRQRQPQPQLDMAQKLPATMPLPVLHEA
jgi:hypothetical protein